MFYYAKPQDRVLIVTGAAPTLKYRVAAILAAMMAAYKKDEGGGTPSITSFVKI
jgi:hypothetical protein